MGEAGEGLESKGRSVEAVMNWMKGVVEVDLS